MDPTKKPSVAGGIQSPPDQNAKPAAARHGDGTRKPIEPGHDNDKARKGEIAHNVRQVYGQFVRNVPVSANSSGVYVPKGSDEFAGKYEVPDGRYRITGYDWIMTFKGGKLTLMQRAQPTMSSDGITEVEPKL